MSSVNKAIILGNVGREPEVKYTNNNTPVANFSVATSERWKDKNTGEWQEKTEWHRIVAWRHLAEKVERSVNKGTKVYIEGKIETRKWTGQDGQDRYTTEINAWDIKVLSKAEGGQQAQSQDSDDGDLPF